MLNRLKRFLAMTLTVLMFINMLPVDALAATTSSWVGVGNYAPTYAISGPTEVTVGESITLESDNGRYSTNTWKSDDPNVAKVTGNGTSAKVEGVSEGTVTITHTYSSWISSKSETYTVTVVAAAEIPTFTVKKGETITLTYDWKSSKKKPGDAALTFNPSGVASLSGKITTGRTGSDSNYTHSHSFTVRGDAKGETTVTLKRGDTVIYTFKLNVTADPYAEIYPTAILPLNGENPDPATALGLMVYDADGNLQDAANYTVAWTSSDEEIVSNNNSVLSTIAEGTANVTATVTLNGTALEAVTCAVTVEAQKVIFTSQSEEIASVTLNPDVSFSVENVPDAAGFTPDHYQFLGWSTDGGVTLLTADEVVEAVLANTDGTSMTFAAVYKEPIAIVFDKNGGSGTAPETIYAQIGDTIVMPSHGDLSYTDKVFSGWSMNQNANGAGSSNYKSPVYDEGDELLISDALMGGNKTLTLYACWARVDVDAEFYIRLDGTIPTEPQGHDVSEYTSKISI